jgi:hypothetical protein
MTYPKPSGPARSRVPHHIECRRGVQKEDAAHDTSHETKHTKDLEHTSRDILAWGLKQESQDAQAALDLFRVRAGTAYQPSLSGLPSLALPGRLIRCLTLPGVAFTPGTPNPLYPHSLNAGFSPTLAQPPPWK